MTVREHSGREVVKIKREKGFTLIEILLALALIGIVSALFFSIFVSGNRFLHEGEARLNLQREISFIGGVFTRELKNSNQILVAEAINEEYDEQFQGRINLAADEGMVIIHFPDGRKRNYGGDISETSFEMQGVEEGRTESLHFQIVAEDSRNGFILELQSEILLNNNPPYSGDNEPGTVLYYNLPS